MKKTKLAASLLAVSMLATTVLAGCDNTQDNSSSGNNSGNSSGTNSDTNSGDSGSYTPENAEWKQTLTYADSTTIRMACGYKGTETGITINADVLAKAGDAVKDGVLTLADGKTYQAGDLKPTWQAIVSKLKFKIEDKYQGNDAKGEWAYWKEQLANVDFVAGNADALNSAGNEGLLLNIAQYLDSMPYFKSYLERNPIVRLSITSAVSGPTAGAIYFSPYFDGVNDIERMPLMRTDWVEKLLNGTEEFNPEKSGTTSEPAYQPYMPTTGSIEVDVVKADGSDTEKVTKDYSKYGNIIAKMNEVGAMSGKDAVKMLRDYIDQTYNGYYGENRADLFIGQNAAWDADELVALLRCVCANAQTLNGTDSVNGLFARNEDQCSRRNNLYQLAATLFGIRGLEGRLEYYYVGADNKLHDCGTEEATYNGLIRMNDLVKEGLVSSGYLTKNKDGKVDNYLSNDNGFMEYDYSQTQALYNESGVLGDGEEFRAVMVPVAYWDTDGDGKQETLMRFTESWRSVKTDAWAISLAGLGYTADNVPKTAAELNDKAKALLTLIDYAYSHEGMVLLSYGPDEFLKKDSSGKVETFDFNGEQWPVISDENYKQLWSIGKGNYTNYARYFIGSTLSFCKSQAFEYQCTTEAGRKGAGYISNAIALGTIKHPELALADNSWYTSVPTTLPNTPTEKATIDEQTNLSTNFDTSSKANVNVLDDFIIVKGYTESGFTSAAEAAATVGTSYGGNIALEQRNAAWERLADYYKQLNG